MKNITGLAVSALACCLTSQALAYTASTHQALSLEAAARSKLFVEPALLSDLGLGPWTALDYVDSSESTNSLRGIIGFGATWEDNAQLARPFNHFFDSQFQSFTGRGLSLPSLTCVPSPDWALEDQSEVSFSGIGAQVYSFRHAQQQYFGMLTATSPASRRAFASSMFQMLGMIIHHIQDMAQPQHTRNEVHPFPPENFYERYTADNIDARIGAGEFTNLYPVPAFSTARQFWHSVASRTDLRARYIGMAEFTGQNYVSLNSVFSISASGTISSNPGFPLPNGIGADGIPKRLESRTESVTLSNGTVKTGVVEYVVGNVFDELLGISRTDRLLASRSLLDGFGNVSRPLALSVGPKVFDNNYDVLLPRAIAFSAGLINHFFRGRMNLRRNPSGGGWFIDNVGQQDLNGNFAVYSEDTSGNRQAITGAFWRTVIPAGQSLSVSFTEPPTGTTRLVAVFNGQIGLEGDATVTPTSFSAVAGKVIAYGPSLAAPTLIAPANNAINQALTPTLQWSGGTAIFWKASISTGTTTVHTSTALAPGQTTYTVPQGILSPGVTYRWNVTACPDATCNDSATFKRSVDFVFSTLIPCTPYQTRGDFHGLDIMHDLGSVPGPVQVEFEAFSIPDMVEVFAGGSLVASTVTLVSGFHPFTFQHNPAARGTQIRLRVIANADDRTAWDLLVSCPNQSLSLPHVTVNVGFDAPPIGSHCIAGIYKFLLNNQQVFSVSQFGGGPAAVSARPGPGQEFNVQFVPNCPSCPPSVNDTVCGGAYFSTQALGKHFLPLGSSGLLDLH